MPVSTKQKYLRGGGILIFFNKNVQFSDCRGQKFSESGVGHKQKSWLRLWEECHVVLKCPVYDDICLDLMFQCNLTSSNCHALSDCDELSFSLSFPVITRVAGKTLTMIHERDQDKFLNKTY